MKLDSISDFERKAENGEQWSFGKHCLLRVGAMGNVELGEHDEDREACALFQQAACDWCTTGTFPSFTGDGELCRCICE